MALPWSFGLRPQGSVRGSGMIVLFKDDRINRVIEQWRLARMPLHWVRNLMNQCLPRIISKGVEAIFPRAIFEGQALFTSSERYRSPTSLELMSKTLLSVFMAIFSTGSALSWTEGELLVWISSDKGWRGLSELGKKFEKELGIPVKVETPDDLTNKFQSAAQGGKGPDIVVWAHDRLGEWAEAHLLKPLEVSEDFKATFLAMTCAALTQTSRSGGIRLPSKQSL